jgi:hypothetical protein
MEIILDGNIINCLGDFYKQLESVIENGECPWGANLDSLQEAVDMQFNCTGNSSFDVTRISWLNADKPRLSLGIPETVRWLENKLQNSASQEHRKTIEKWIIEVMNGRSETLFDKLSEILSSNPQIEFKQL